MGHSRRIGGYIAVLVVMAAISGCKTLKGVGTDIKQFGHAISGDGIVDYDSPTASSYSRGYGYGNQNHYEGIYSSRGTSGTPTYMVQTRGNKATPPPRQEFAQNTPPPASSIAIAAAPTPPPPQQLAMAAAPAYSPPPMEATIPAAYAYPPTTYPVAYSTASYPASYGNYGGYYVQPASYYSAIPATASYY